MNAQTPFLSTADICDLVGITPVCRPLRVVPALSAKLSFEIEIEVTGTFQPGYAATGPSYSSGGDPGMPDMIEDLDVSEIGGLRVSYANKRIGEKPSWTTVDFLKGVDRDSDAFRKIVENILDFVGEDASQALLDEAGE